ncbi:hypothetical protein ScPMuIL_000371 [Solemya velum]
MLALRKLVETRTFRLAGCETVVAEDLKQEWRTLQSTELKARAEMEVNMKKQPGQFFRKSWEPRRFIDTEKFDGEPTNPVIANISSKHMYVNYTNYGDSNGTGLFFNLSQKQMAKNSYALCGSNYCHYHPIEHEGMKVDDTTKNICWVLYSGGVISLLVISLFLEPLKLTEAPALNAVLSLNS